MNKATDTLSIVAEQFRESSNSYVVVLESVTTGCIFNNEVTIGFSSIKTCYTYLITLTSLDVASQIKQLINKYRKLCDSMNYSPYPVSSFTYRIEQVRGKHKNQEGERV
jgi:hypothetical protein